MSEIIPAPPGIYVWYRRKTPDGVMYRTEQRVIAFNSDGEPLVVDSDHGRLFPAQGKYGLFDTTDYPSCDPPSPCCSGCGAEVGKPCVFEPTRRYAP